MQKSINCCSINQGFETSFQMQTSINCCSINQGQSAFRSAKFPYIQHQDVFWLKKISLLLCFNKFIIPYRNQISKPNHFSNFKIIFFHLFVTCILSSWCQSYRRTDSWLLYDTLLDKTMQNWRFIVLNLFVIFVKKNLNINIY